MKKIDSYIDSLYKHMDKQSKEVQSLKQEMRNHLLQTVYELKAEGRSEEESIEIAINRFGESSQLENELEEVFKVHRKFAITILLASLISLLLAAICFSGYKIAGKNFSLTVPKSLENAVSNKLEMGGAISNEEVDQLLTKYKAQFRYVALYKDNNFSSPYKIYPSNFSVEEVQNDHTSYLAESITAPNGIVWEVRYGFDYKGFNLSTAPILLIITIIFFVVYWLLFGIWCVVKAYHGNKLSLAWIILFFVLNVAAYIMFLLDRTSSLKTKVS